VEIDQRMPRFFALRAAAALRGVLGLSDVALPERAGVRSWRAATSLPFRSIFDQNSSVDFRNFSASDIDASRDIATSLQVFPIGA
jgi:hypothetical protein